MNYSNQHEKELNERCIEMLLILREAPEHPDIKYNSKYFEKYFHKSNVTILRDARILKDHELIESKHHQYILKKGFDDEILSSDTKKQIVLIAGIKGLLQQYKDTPLFKIFFVFLYHKMPPEKKTVFSS